MFQHNTDELWTGLVLHKITVVLLVGGGMAACALLRPDVAIVVAAYALTLIGNYINTSLDI